MKPLALLLLLVVIAFAAWLMSWRPGDEPEQTRRDETRWDDERPAAARSPEHDGSSLATSTYPGEPHTGSGERRLRGLVRQPDGRSPGVLRLHAALYRGGLTEGKALAETSLATAPDGSFDWRLPRSVDLVTCVVTVAEPDRIAKKAVLTLIPEEGAPACVTLEVHKLDRQLRVRVVDRNGRPVEGARVDLEGLRTIGTTDLDGQLAVAWSRTLLPSALRVTARGYAALSLPLPPPAGEVTELVLEPGFELSGRIFDEGGRPAASARVQVEGHPGHSGVSAEDGRFEIAGIPGPAGGKAVAVRHPELLPASVPVPDPPGPMTITLARGIPLEGRVTSPSDRPIADVAVVLTMRGTPDRELRALTGSEGTFRFPSLCPGPLELLALHPQHVPHGRTLELGPEGTDPLAIVLAEGRALGGRVLDEELLPVEGAMVLATPVDGSTARRTTSDAGGSFELTGLTDADVDLEVHAPGHLPDVKRGLPVGRLNLDIILVAAGALEGQVVDERNEPVTSFRLAVGRSIGRRSQRSPSASEPAAFAPPGVPFEDPEGRFTTGNVALAREGAYRIEIRADGFRTAVVPEVLAHPPPWREPLVIRLERGSSAEGRLVSAAGGAPIEGALIAPPGGFEAQREGDGVPGPSAVSGSDGRFHIDGLPLGGTGLEVRHPGFLPQRTGELLLQNGSVRSAGVIVLHPRASLRVSLRGARAPDARVKVDASAFGWSIERELGPESSLLLDPVPAGELTVTLLSQRPELNGLGTVLRLQPSEEANVVFEPPTSGTVSGTVQAGGSAPAGTPLQLRLLRIVPGQEPVLHEARDAAIGGSFQFSPAPPGHYRLEAVVEHSGFRHAGSLDLVVQPGDNPVILRVVPVR